ncbi:hypothetical protein [Rhizobium ruizarguesonis]|uniref:hypothetical protein n=1 Tax=Rhizobium ruizarguesonis TaxID=2081791 RepID=UPI001FE1C065|nr:hypothetical protein [Rhizobium ruizarguesonis]
MANDGAATASVYKHETEAVQRPDVGVEAQFSNKKAPKNYRYDSSLAPELAWDENSERAFAEWLLGLIADAAAKGEDDVFAQPQVWQGTEEHFTSLSHCAARLRSLTNPFLNWAGKAERQQIKVPTLPLFVHERHSTQAILDTLNRLLKLALRCRNREVWVRFFDGLRSDLSWPQAISWSYWLICLPQDTLGPSIRSISEGE